MRDIVTLCFLAALQFGMVLCIDQSVHLSFSPVIQNRMNSHRLRRAVVELSPSSYTEEEKKAMLDAHNEHRMISNPSASDMNLLTWNAQLADSAQTWTEQCIWDHGQVEFDNQQYDPMGQNLWRGGNKVSVSAINAWMNEFRYFTYSNNTCQYEKVCGHYTQVLWGDTKEVGCGFYSCDDGSTIVACNYGPAGNYNRQPYVEGPRCTACSSPGFCYDGALCSTQCDDESAASGSCKCSFECKNCGVLNETSCTCECKPGWHGHQCEVKCEDTHRYCNNGWYKAQCVEKYSYVLNGCPAMCSLCEEPTKENAVECPCDGKMCKNGGKLDTGTCTCDCTDGYSGDFCESEVSETTTQTDVARPTISSICDGKTCLNNGYLTTETCTCECPDEYTGSLCEFIVMATTVVPAIGGKTIMTTIGSKVATTIAAIRTTAKINKVTDQNNEEANNTTIPPWCQLTCPTGFVVDITVCECIEYIYEKKPPIGSANLPKRSPVCVIITTFIVLSHVLGAW